MKLTISVDGAEPREMTASELAGILTDEERLSAVKSIVRGKRDMKLATEVDPIAGNALRWAALTAEQQQAWADYRQALLDVPTQDGFPHDVVWPTKP